MRKVLALFAIASLIICSCKSKSDQPSASPAQAPSAREAKASTGMAATILEFYKAYCTEGDCDVKSDSILSKYCTEELRKVVMETAGEYDFVVDGGIPSLIHSESIHVVKKNEKYVVYFEYTPWPAREEPAKDSVYVMVNKENKISYIIRPEDNYRVPNAYYGERLYSFEDYEFVDLGLSVNWATFNIGSYKFAPYMHGDFFAWGETMARNEFVKNYYLEPKQDHYYEGKLNVIESCDDAAAVLWGEDWRMPTKEEFQELIDKCKWEWKEQDYHWGYKVTGQNGNSIFLPAGGMKLDRRSINESSGLYYWTGSCKFDDPEREPKAWQFFSVSDGPDQSTDRHTSLSLTPLSLQSGRSIRPVTEKQFVPISDITITRTDLKMTIGDEYTLAASFIPEDATKKNIYWRSGNSAVAYVDINGKVTAISDGKCTITAVCGKFKKECQVTVVRPKGYVPDIPEKVTTIYEFGKEVDSSLIDIFEDYPDSLILKEVFKTHVGDGSKGFDITFSDFANKDWEEEPGEYCMITIETAQGKYQFKNGDWMTHELFDNYYFHCHPVDKSRYLLFVRGFDYGCCPGVLTVLAIDNTGARVVYNQECAFKELNKEPFSITIQDWYSEYVSRYKTDYSAEYNLFVEDGALKMKRVELLHE
jgi:uncharacterized protein YjdB